MGPSLAWRFLAGKVGLGNGLIVGLTRGCLDHGCEITVDADVKQLLQEGGARHRRGGGDRRQAADDPRAQGRRAGDRRLRLGAGLHAEVFPRHAS